MANLEAVNAAGAIALRSATALIGDGDRGGARLVAGLGLVFVEYGEILSEGQD